MATTETATELHQNDDEVEALKQKEQDINQESAGMETIVHSEVVDDVPDAGAMADDDDAAMNADVTVAGSATDQDAEQKEDVVSEQPKETIIEVGDESDDLLTSLKLSPHPGLLEEEVSIAHMIEMNKRMQSMRNEMERMKKKEEEEKEGKIQKFFGEAPGRLGSFLRHSLYATWALHAHLLICLCIPVVFCCESFCWEYDLDLCFGPFMLLLGFITLFGTPFVVTLYLINEYMDNYDEIQSWQISYCIWSTSCGILTVILMFGEIMESRAQRKEEALLEMMEEEDPEGFEKVMAKKEKEMEENKGGFRDKFQGVLLLPFGVSAETGIEITMWMIPLISIAVAIVGGFFANYALDERYLLKCDPSYTDGMCFGPLCCRPIGSHEVRESSRFVGDLASNILAGWAVVKAIAEFILMNDDTVSPQQRAKDYKNSKKEMEEQLKSHIDQMENERQSEETNTEPVEDKIEIKINGDEAQEDIEKETEKDTKKESEDSKV